MASSHRQEQFHDFLKRKLKETFWCQYYLGIKENNNMLEAKWRQAKFYEFKKETDINSLKNI